MLYSLVCVAMSLCSLLIGMNVGLKTQKEQPLIEVPNIPTPKKILKKRENEKRRKVELDILHNCEVFDGTANGQKEIKK